MWTLSLCVLALAVGAGAQDWSLCWDGTVWNDCGSSCNKTCTEREISCIDVCVPRCECPKDQYWHEESESCVTAQECDWMGMNETDLGGPSLSHCSNCVGGECNMYGACDYCNKTRYGWDCSMYCSDNCLHGVCDQTVGFCSFGCVKGKEGPFCLDNCKRGCDYGWGCEWYTGVDMYSDDDWSFDCPKNMTCYNCTCQGHDCEMISASSTRVLSFLLMPAVVCFLLLLLA